VRKAAQDVQVTARITDDRSGVGDGGAYVCLTHVVDTEWSTLACTDLLLTSGTSTNGYFRGVIRMPAGSLGGSWSTDISLNDRAHPASTGYWLGPQSYAAHQAQAPDPRNHPIPSGGGTFSVVGINDIAPPVLTHLRITPAQADTLPSAVTVSVEVDATDDAGVTGAFAVLTGADGQTSYQGAYLQAPTSGTAVNGTWHFDITLPQGVPPQTLTLEIGLVDRAHSRYWFSATSPYAGSPSSAVFTPDQLDSGTDVVTVVPH